MIFARVLKMLSISRANARLFGLRSVQRTVVRAAQPCRPLVFLHIAPAHALRQSFVRLQSFPDGRSDFRFDLRWMTGGG